MRILPHGRKAIVGCEDGGVCLGWHDGAHDVITDLAFHSPPKAREAQQVVLSHLLGFRLPRPELFEGRGATLVWNVQLPVHEILGTFERSAEVCRKFPREFLKVRVAHAKPLRKLAARASRPIASAPLPRETPDNQRLGWAPPRSGLAPFRVRFLQVLA